MSGKTSIEWTDKSSNPLRAYTWDNKRGWFCVHASPGCLNCYAERLNLWRGNGQRYTAQNLKNVRFEMHQPELLSWLKLKPGTKVFPFDMTDVFQDGVSDELLDQAFAAMALSKATFQVLTKRAERMRRYLSDRHTNERTARASVFLVPNAQLAAKGIEPELQQEAMAGWSRWPLPNVWLGVSVEDQQRADERIALLLQTPAAVRWVSYEPALGPVDFTRVRGAALDGPPAYLNALRRTPGLGGLDWIVVGGESGPGARPMDVSSARNTVAQCKAAGVPVFYKQGGSSNRCAHSSKGGHFECFPDDLKVREFPRVLDGRELR